MDSYNKNKDDLIKLLNMDLFDENYIKSIINTLKERNQPPSKVCKKCGDRKELNSFYNKRRVCKECIKNKNKSYYASNREKWKNKD